MLKNARCCGSPANLAQFSLATPSQFHQIKFITETLDSDFKPQSYLIVHRVNELCWCTKNDDDGRKTKFFHHAIANQIKVWNKSEECDLTLISSHATTSYSSSANLALLCNQRGSNSIILFISFNGVQRSSQSHSTGAKPRASHQARRGLAVLGMLQAQAPNSELQPPSFELEVWSFMLWALRKYGSAI